MKFTIFLILVLATVSVYADGSSKATYSMVKSDKKKEGKSFQSRKITESKVQEDSKPDTDDLDQLIKKVKSKTKKSS